MNMFYLCCTCAKTAQNMAATYVSISKNICETLIILAIIIAVSFLLKNVKINFISSFISRKREIEDQDRKVKSDATEKLLGYLKEHNKNDINDDYVNILKKLAGIDNSTQDSSE